MKKEIYADKIVKDWCKDMMEEYLKYWSSDDDVYKKLLQFYNEGVIKGLIYRSMSQGKKIKILDNIMEELNQKYDESVKNNTIKKTIWKTII